MINKNDSGIFELDGSYTIENAKNLKDELLKIDTSENVVFNIEKLTTFDASFFQLLLALQVDVNKNGKKVLFEGKIPEEFQNAWQVSGFSHNPNIFDDGVELLNTIDM